MACRTVGLHLRRCAISRILVNDREAEFIFEDPLEETAFSSEATSPNGRRRVDEIREVSEELRTGEETAELQVILPPSVFSDISEELKALPRQTDEDAQGGSPRKSPACHVHELPTLRIEINYEPRDASVCVPSVAAHRYIRLDGRQSGVRLWAPCRDSANFFDRCPWKISVFCDEDLFAIASGDLIETSIPSPTEAFRPEGVAADEPLKLFRFALAQPTPASDIAVLVGPFLPLADPGMPSELTHFALPGLASELISTAPPLFARAHAFCSDYFSLQLPHTSLKQVFVASDDSCCGVQCAAGGLIVHSCALLHGKRCIDEAINARSEIARGVVHLYLGTLIRPRCPEDAWFVSGLAEHVSSLAIASFLGKNWYKAHVHTRMREMSRDSGRKVPSLVAVTSDPRFSIERAPHAIRRRAHMIAYIIERRIGNDVFRRVLRDLVAESHRAVVGESSNEEALRGLSIGPFLKRIRAICGTDVRNLVRSWASTNGIPRIRFGYRYNARRHQVEVAVEQRSLSDAQSGAKAHGLAFQGSLSFRLMESEGSFDHAVEVIDPCFVAELSCHSRRTKQKAVSQADKDARDEASRSAPIAWMRVDPDMEWCIDATLVQPEQAWIAMLRAERDVAAQVDACNALAEFGTETAAKALLEALANKEHYWHVRKSAADALAACEGGLVALITYFQSSFCTMTADAAALMDENATLDLLPNDFSDVAEYMVRRAVVRAIASSTLKSKAPASCHPYLPTFFVSVLAGNDNTRNMFDDDHYIADVLECAADVAERCGDENPAGRALILAELEHYRERERLLPSRSGAVSAALVRALARVEQAQLRSASGSAGSSVLRNLVRGRGSANEGIMNLVTELTRLGKPFTCRAAGMMALATLCSGDLEVFLWLLSHVDQYSCPENAKIYAYDRPSPSGAMVESPCMRRLLLQGLLEAARSSVWGDKSPMLNALRRSTKRAVEGCCRIVRIALSDSDEQVRSLACKLAITVWGVGVPGCLFKDDEYRRVRVGDWRHPLPLNMRPKPPPVRTYKPAMPGAKPEVVFPRKPIHSPRIPSSPRAQPHPKHSPPTPRVTVKPSTSTPSKRPRTVQPTAPSDHPKKAAIMRPPAVPESVPKSQRPIEEVARLKMAEEDRQYLIRAWSEHARQKDTHRRKGAVCDVTPENGMSLVGDAGEGNEHEAAMRRSEALGPGADGGIEAESLRKEKKKKKKKKKRKREDHGDGDDGVSGDEGDDGRHAKKKRKKKKKHRSDSADGGGDDDGARGDGRDASSPLPSESRQGIPTLKIKLGGLSLP